MDTTGGWKRGDYKRACDICGHPWKRSKMRSIGLGRLACPDDYRGLTAEQISAYNASVPPLIVKAHKNVRYQTEIDTYQHDEALLFNLVLKHARTAGSFRISGHTVNAPGVLSRSFCALYLYDIIVEGARPAKWITAARETFRGLADDLVDQQWSNPYGANTQFGPDLTIYGGVAEANSSSTPYGNAAAGLVFLRAHALFGDAKYLLGAQLSAHYLRNTQRCDAWHSGQRWTGTATLGERRYLGGWPSLINSNGQLASDSFWVRELWIVKFLAALRDVVGGSARYGFDGTPGVHFFLSPLDGTLDQMIEEAMAFYMNGVIPEGGSAPVSLIGPPGVNRFSARIVNASGTIMGDGTHKQSETIGPDNHQLGLLGLLALEGGSTRLRAAYDWLMAFTTDAAISSGTYRPAEGLSLAMDPVTQKNASDFQRPHTMGDLAPIRAALGESVLDSKERLARPVRTPLDGFIPRPLVLLPSISTGTLTTAATAQPVFTEHVARLGGLYRYAPKTGSAVRAAS